MTHHPIDALSETAESLVAMAGGYAKMFEAIERGDVLALVRVNLGSVAEDQTLRKVDSRLATPHNGADDPAESHAMREQWRGGLNNKTDVQVSNPAAAHHNER